MGSLTWMGSRQGKSEVSDVNGKNEGFYFDAQELNASVNNIAPRFRAQAYVYQAVSG
jgi:hypothetical protein